MKIVVERVKPVSLALFHMKVRIMGNDRLKVGDETKYNELL